jgi:hypothetical protein
MRGVPLAVIAAQSGHAGTRMAERHHSPWRRATVADTV